MDEFVVMVAMTSHKERTIVISISYYIDQDSMKKCLEYR